ncbi:DPBB-1 domain-containing protein [Mycena indigotica]|uniref:DPBB-1 domain-containing protein n=1 Tax=Mycena indigotica TaxID=2126181 RepID=A0A8H6SCY4_9AGAR|nr:DPBB-1 domain-containing protein [Mycena indigotica]KAF7297245.1 DPBB-1 domain-containing protein [Mycena indigotica]
MLFQLPISALLLAIAVLTEASSQHGRGAHLAHARRRPLNPRGEQPLVESKRAINRRSSCRKKGSSDSLIASSTKTAHSTIANVAQAPTTTSKKATQTNKSNNQGSNQAVAAGNFVPKKPSDWPTATQAGRVPTSTVASAHDPYLEELSKAIDYSGYDMFTQVHEGDMTYYGQGLGACGDVYDDNSFTAAVSQDMFDTWPGASGAQNRNPICGPFVPGRQALNNAGLMVTAIKSSIAGHALIGGDGLINCVGSADVQCHIPMTATVTHGSKSIQVKIVDRCVGCKVGDIDLTPAAFAALADPALGRTSVKWQFNKWN